MAIQFVGGIGAGRAGTTSTVAQSINGTLTGGIASSPAEGDLVLVVVATATQARNPSCAISGWSTIGTQLNVTTQTYDVSLQVSYKFMGSTPDTSITIPATGNAADGQSRRVLVFRGVDPTTPFDVAAVSATGTGTTRFSAPAITPTTAGAFIVIFGGGAASASTTVLGTPSGISGWGAYNGADTNDGSAGGGYYGSWTSGSYNPAAPTTGGSVNTANSWAAWTIALRPAATVEDYPYTGSGGAVTGSAATTSWHRQFSYTGSGGATAAGAATTAKFSQRSYTGSGGAIAAGAATTAYSQPPTDPYTQKYWSTNYWADRYWGSQYWAVYANTASAYSWTGVGGALTGGAADSKKGKVYIGIGGAATSGLAVVKKGKSLTASGGAITGGAAVLKKGKVFIASGGAVASGVAVTTWHRQYAYVGSGGAVTGGAALLRKSRSWVGSGGAVASGSALLTKSRSWVGSGGAVSGGAAITSNSALNTYSYTGVGGAATSGAAVVKKGKVYSASGGAVTGGAAVTAWRRQFAYVGSGGALTSGAATLARTVAWAYTSVGGAVSGGSALTSSGGLQAYVGSGGATTGGAAETSYSVWRSYVASGGAVTDGAADASYHSSLYEYSPDGGAETAGEAVCFFVSGQDLRINSNAGLRRFNYSFTTPFAS